MDRHYNALCESFLKYHPLLSIWAYHQYEEKYTPAQINRLLLFVPAHVFEKRSANLQPESFELSLELFQSALHEIAGDDNPI